MHQMVCPKVYTSKRFANPTYKDNASSYEKLLENDNSVSIHQKSLQLLMVEINKTRNHLNPSFMMEILEEKAMPYQLRSSRNLNLPKVRTTCYGTDTVRFMGQRIQFAYEYKEYDLHYKSCLLFIKNSFIIARHAKRLLIQMKRRQSGAARQTNKHKMFQYLSICPTTPRYPSPHQKPHLQR